MLQVAAIEGEGGAATRACVLADGTAHPLRHGAGRHRRGAERASWPQAAGLDCAGGVVVDLAARSSDPLIYAIGDCTQRPLPLYGRTGRLESVPNAIEQAKQAAADICGRPPPPPEVPWFWSDQFDLRLQMAGLAFDAHEVVVRGDTDGARLRRVPPGCGRIACWRWRR